MHIQLAGIYLILSLPKTTLTQGADARVLFGNTCHPDMCQIINNNDGKSLGAKNCVHAFCGESLSELEQNRTMVITPGWIRFFHNIMAASGWDEVDVRQNFGRYDQFLLMETGVNPISEEEILEFYELIEVPIEIQQVDLDHFRAKLIEVLQ